MTTFIGNLTGNMILNGVSVPVVAAVTTTATVVTPPVPTPLVISGNLPGGQVGVPYPMNNLAVTGGNASYTWGLTGVPPGLTVSKGQTNLFGTPTVAGPYTVVATVTDSSTPALAQHGSYPVAIAPAAVITPPSGPIPTNVQLILQGQNEPVATQNLNNTVVAKGGTTQLQSNWNYIGFKSVTGATSYNVYRSKNGTNYLKIDSIAATDAATDYAAYLVLYPAQKQTYGNYIQTQCSPASGIDSAYYDKTAIGTMQPAAGTAFAATGSIVAGSTSVTIMAVASGTLVVGQGIGTVSSANIPIGATIVSAPTGGGPGVYTISEPALASFTGVIGSVLFGNQAYTYYVTAVSGGVESAPSDFAYIPFITNGGLVMCNGAFDSCTATQQVAPTPSPLGYTPAACWFPIQPTSGGKCSGYPSYFNAFSGNSSGNFNLNIGGYKYCKISLCPSTAGLGPAGGGSEICGDVTLVNMNGATMAEYGPASWAQNEWSTYKIPLEAMYTDAGTGVLQSAFYKMTWGVGGNIPANTAMFVEMTFTVD